MCAIKNFFNRNFREPVVYARVAEMLREGAHMVRVKYRNRIEPRYYTGTGNAYNNCLGARKRWSMTVHRFDYEGQGKFIGLGLPWMNHEELDLLLDWGNNNVYEISSVPYHDTDPADIGAEITNIVRRLKPGQGYNFFGVRISQDAIKPEGYLLDTGAHRVLTPVELLNTNLILSGYQPGRSFDPKCVTVADEKLIKRQHRPNHDLARWVEIKQVPSVDDDWAIRYTHPDTAGAPVFYYSVEINIDNKSMKAHPFYITELVNHALARIRKIHNHGHYDLNQVNIKITWNGETKPLLTWIDNVRRYPALLDEQPNIIYNTLESKAVYKYGGGSEFTEVRRD